ncbi:MAG: hypothetical protein EZS28_025204 [Streblomastix strix]|uniref:Uncharacterized protein n=1 Tax=Streblomastix strix TaxID=222440 RepID=A0A5J4V9N9_9EUKA|nr:MAG: hypothetical protein EZS28_025204 [Streblomastix strix]
MKDQTRHLNKEVRQGDRGVTNYYPLLSRRQGNDLLSPNKERIPEIIEGSNKRNDTEAGLERMKQQCRDKDITLSKLDKFDITNYRQRDVVNELHRRI